MIAEYPIQGGFAGTGAVLILAAVVFGIAAHEAHHYEDWHRRTAWASFGLGVAMLIAAIWLHVFLGDFPTEVTP